MEEHTFTKTIINIARLSMSIGVILISVTVFDDLYRISSGTSLFATIAMEVVILSTSFYNMFMSMKELR